MMPGTKHDGGKLRWGLMPWGPLQEVVRVLMFGAKKYEEDHNWQKVKDGRSRYFEAGIRHTVAFWMGERIDSDSGCHHLACAVCNFLFALWFDGVGRPLTWAEKATAWEIDDEVVPTTVSNGAGDVIGTVVTTKETAFRQRLAEILGCPGYENEVESRVVSLMTDRAACVVEAFEAGKKSVAGDY